MTLNFRFCEYLIACTCRNQNHHLVFHSLQTIDQWVPMQTISQKMSGQKIIGTQYSTIFILSLDHCCVSLKMVNLEAYDSKVKISRYALCPIHHVCVDQQSKLQSHAAFMQTWDMGPSKFMIKTLEGPSYAWNQNKLNPIIPYYKILASLLLGFELKVLKLIRISHSFLVIRTLF